MKTIKMCVAACVISTCIHVSVAAQEATSFQYDALGRIILTTASGSVGSQTVTTSYDPAGNRTNFAIYGAPHAPGFVLEGPAAVIEGNKSVFVVKRVGLNTVIHTVEFATLAVTGSGMATAGQDYSSISGTLSFAPGETQKTISVQTIDDTISEPTETVSVRLSNPSAGATIFGASQVTGTINDNDPAGCRFTAVNVEGSDEFTVYPFIQRTGSCTSSVTIGYSLQIVSGSGQAQVGQPHNQNSQNTSVLGPTDQALYLPIYPVYGSVPIGTSLVLKVIWSIMGDGAITPNGSIVTVVSSQ